MGVKVAFLGAEAPKAAAAPPLTIPKAALRADAGSQVVFVVAAGDRAERRAVRVGTARDDRVEILSGLTPGEKIVIEPPATLKDGDKVVVK
jgi:multidrug efflux pump subunit AcrA (membrane-fusion protein)